MMNPFRKKSETPDRLTDRAAAGRRAKDRKPTPLTSDPAVSPFLADHTRGGLTDRFAELNRRRSDWVLIAAGLLVCLLVSLGMNAYQAARTTLIPFKIVVDGNDGYLLESGPLEPMSGVEDLYVRRELRDVISGLRTATGDLAATRAQFMSAYAHLDEESATYPNVQDLLSREGNNPMMLVGQGQRTITRFVGPTRLQGTDTWQVGWTERAVVVGVGVTEETFNGSMTVDVRQPRDQATLEENPLGVWVTGITWERVSTRQLGERDLDGGSPLDMLYPDQPRVVRPAAPTPADSVPAARRGTPPAATTAPPAGAPAATPAP